MIQSMLSDRLVCLQLLPRHGGLNGPRRHIFHRGSPQKQLSFDTREEKVYSSQLYGKTFALFYQLCLPSLSGVLV